MRHKLLYALILVVFMLAIGTLFYAYVEGWSYVDSFYFSTMTLTTIGFGDLVPSTDMAKLFTSFYAVFGIGIMLYIIISVIGVFIFKQERIFSRIFFPMKIKDHEKDIQKQEDEIKKQEEIIRKQQREIKTQQKEIRRIGKKIEKTRK